eukprot:TRINITY_DN8600_c0_g1_i3.p1 TRINITY_DN8600_c0_g1~~TRINITY_DN8600_c0_g1_i3.p1  ORF type:complete len:116 (+),score=5.10 TRINITY_DN8600_c0_g1_i3:1-348(+)
MALRASSKAVRRAFQTRMMTTEAAEHGPVGTSIVNKLKEKFQPNHLQVINESYMHNVPKGSETHFKVVVVSDQFSDMRILQVGSRELTRLARGREQMADSCGYGCACGCDDLSLW